MELLEETLLNEYGVKGKELIDTFSLPSFHAVLLNPNKISDEDFLLCYPNVKKHPVVPHAYFYDKNEYELGKSLLHQIGAFYLQDPSAMIPGSILPLKDGDIILDACAAPGGKSLQIAFRNPNILLLSNEIQHSRAEVLSSNIEKYGIAHTIVTSMKVSDFEGRKFSSIILDAPCSGSGMIRKDSRMKDDWSIEKVKKNAEIQKELLENCYSFLQDGGYLLYSTCSYSSLENHLQIRAFLSKHSDLKEIKIPILDSYNFLENEVGYLLTPSSFMGEGQYICLLKKDGNPSIEIPLNRQDIFYKDIKWSLPFSYPIKNLKILRLGLKVSETKNGIEKFDHAYGVYQNTPALELTLDETKQYLSGNCIRKKAPKGWISLSYHHIHFAIGKSDGETIKNHYPKGLRRNFTDLLPF